MSLKDQYNRVIQAYLVAFSDMYDFDDVEYTHRSGMVLACEGSYCFTLDNVLTAVDLDISREVLLNWHDLSLQRASENRPCQNLENYFKFSQMKVRKFDFRICEN